MSGIDNNTLWYLRGDSFNDISINNATITNVNSTLDTTNKCIHIAGNGVGIEMPAMSYTGDFTIETWFMLTAVPWNGNAAGFGSPLLTPKHISDGVGNNQPFITIKNGSSSNYVGDKVAFSDHGSSTPVLQSTTSIAFNQWYHVALVRSSGTMSLFINGVKEATASYTKTFTITYPKIGCINNAEYSQGLKIKNYRVSNIARYSSNFTASQTPFTSVSINTIALNEETYNMTCQVSKLSSRETINKVDILINSNVVKTFTSGYDNMAYNLKNDSSYGENTLEIRAYYYDSYYVNNNMTYVRELILEEFEPLEILPETANLSDLMQHMSKIDSAINAMLNNLKTLLEDKGFDVGENPKLNVLIKSVKELDNNNSTEITQYVNKITILESEKATLNQNITTLNNTIENNKTLLYNKLVSKNVTGISSSSTFQALINAMDSLASNAAKTYLYDSGNEYTNITGGWKTNQFDPSFPYANIFTKGSTYLEYGESNTGNYGYGGYVTTNSIDLTNYNTLVAKLQLVSYAGNAQNQVIISTSSTPSIRNSTITKSAGVNQSNGTTAAEVTMDISSVTGKYYIGVYGSSGSYADHLNTSRCFYVYLKK